MKIIKLTQAQDINTYQPSKSLTAVLNMSISLGRPLLLAGKPGVGKTQFAHWFANQDTNNFNKSVLQFNTKSTSIFSDLFYEYDAVSHFRDANISRSTIDDNNKTAADYITLTALGFAIVCAKGLTENNDRELDRIIRQSQLKFKIEELKPKSVVLIDEIDKAPRDFPNDLLYEIENLSFTIKEINLSIKLTDEEKQNIVVILTSNDEKNLPDAFLRRCIFYYIDFPDEKELKTIVLKKLSVGLEELSPNEENGFNEKMAWFIKISEAKNIEKKPSISECIDWINFLKENKLLDKGREECENSFSILLKKKGDLNEFKNILPGTTNLTV
ncbi:AAA family ATPase [Pedobacter vanadiisoli]|uniref:AAA family ATPase n=1 Tax=Pedobacter vanadiisoli TaxID=1761975 RepID=A0ABW5MI20_9SPHI